jgi:PIN domain nuclease of toxin-antitoxin system
VTEATTAVVADTHIVIWYVLNPAKLSSEATEALEGCVAAGEPIRVSAHSLIELVYAVERATNPFSEEDRQAVLETFEAEDSPFEVVPVTAEIANRVAAVPRWGQIRRSER